MRRPSSSWASAAVVLIPYLAVTEDFSALTLTPFAVGMLLIVGVVHTGVAYALYFGSMDGLRAQTVALFSYIDPVTAIVLSALLLHERMTPFGVLGAVLVLGSTIVSEVWTPKEKTNNKQRPTRGSIPSGAAFILFLDKNISYVFITMGYAHGRRTDVRRRKPFNI